MAEVVVCSGSVHCFTIEVIEPQPNSTPVTWIRSPVQFSITSEMLAILYHDLPP